MTKLDSLSPLPPNLDTSTLTVKIKGFLLGEVLALLAHISLGFKGQTDKMSGALLKKISSP
jgi:hypothetical protein